MTAKKSKITVEELRELIDTAWNLKQEHAELKKQTTEKWNEHLNAKRKVLNCLEVLKLKGQEGTKCKVSKKVEESYKFPGKESIEDRKAFFDWFKKKEGMPGILKNFTYNSRSFNSFVQKEVEKMEEDGDLGWLPPGVGEPSMSIDVQFRKK